MERMAELIARYARPGRVEWIGVRPERRGAMRALETVEVTEAGLAGDHGRAGKRAVTLVQAEHLAVIGAFLGRDAAPAEALRRNLVVSGINLAGLRGRAVALGGASLTTLITVLGLLLWDRFAVVTRAAAQGLRHQEFIMGLRAIGASRARILFLEILPNMRATILVVVSLEVANVILLEAALSFLGLGVRPPTPSWGLMIAEGRDNILFDPWLIALPGSALCLLVLAVNLFGDGLRDITGPARK